MTEQWVNDKLHDILGMSERRVGEFLIDLAKKSLSEDGLINAIRQMGVIHVDTKVVAFANELYYKVHTVRKVNQAGNIEHQAVTQERKNLTYYPLSDEDGPGPSTARVTQTMSKSDSDDDTIVNRRDEPRKRVKLDVPEEEDEIERMEWERDEDIKSRDEFALRLKEQDDTKPHRNATTSGKKGLKRLKPEDVKRDEIISDLRTKSRRKYLEKRKEDKILAVKEDLADDVRLFKEEELTTSEKQGREYNRKILALTEEHDSAGDIVKRQRYIMPEERRGTVQDSQYQETDPRERIPNEKKWELEQMGLAQYKFGSKDAKSKTRDQEYEMLLDEQKFIQTLKKLGNQKEKVKELTEMEKKRMTIEATQKKSAHFSL